MVVYAMCATFGVRVCSLCVACYVCVVCVALLLCDAGVVVLWL